MESAIPSSATADMSSSHLEALQTVGSLGDLFHISFAVQDLEAAMSLYATLFGGTATQTLDSESWARMPQVSDSPTRVRDRVAWLVGGALPIEFHEGGPGSPWHNPNSILDFHHVAYYVNDLDEAAAALQAHGFELEMTTVHRGTGIVGMAYLRHPNGLRVEIQGAGDCESMEAWVLGEPLILDWIKDLL
jgi:catechol 2,3-dioxygenase-like lactoylglutathione lyase family enzyme